MDNGLNGIKPPELCKVMRREIVLLTKMIKEMKRRRWEMFLWLIPTVLIVVNMWLDHK